ncbi:hypothetical protein M0R45_037274 [Rubus argutus]|uniref:OTU domain-containing protein n=1 Tax=Rubus argutus TaxID=59490 RepID=A0AAW1W028_RUBAR
MSGGLRCVRRLRSHLLCLVNSHKRFPPPATGEASEAVLCTPAEISAFVPCEQSQALPPEATGGASEAVLCTPADISSFVPCEQLQALPPAATGGASEAVLCTPADISSFVPCEQSQALPPAATGGASEAVLCTPADISSFVPCEQSQALPPAAIGGASEAVQRRTVDENVSSGALRRPAVMNGTSPAAQVRMGEILEQILVEHSTEDQLVHNNNIIIKNGITTCTSGEGWRVVQPRLLDKKATQQDKERCRRAAESIARSNVDSTLPTDYTSEFTRNEKFKSREDLIEWARDVGRSNGFHIVTLRSDNGKGNKRPRVTLGCERSGKYDSRPPKKEIQIKDRTHTGTKKCDCPFQLKGNKLDTDWQLTVVKGKHNHPVEYSEVGRSFLGGLSSSREKDDIEPLGETAKPSGLNERMKGQILSKKMNTSTHFALPSSDIIVESAQHNSTTCGPPILHSKEGRQIEEKVYCLPFKYVGVCPSVMRPYILDIQDVASDGHCGFRAVASLLGDSNEDGWIKVRIDLMKELQFYSAQYTQLFKSETKVDELRHALEYYGSTCLYQREHWMKMPDMGHLIASRYNVVLMHFSSAQCRTYFPLRSVPLSSPKEMAIGLVNEHFVQVF